MSNFNPNTKTDDYASLEPEVESLLEENWFTNLANTSAVLAARIPDLNWAGFYVAEGDQLLLGPFQGWPACLRIPFGKGVCGTAAAEKRSLIVSDVHEFPGHIACDSRSRSELVIPMIQDGRVLGVLDLDSPTPDRFGPADLAGLERIVDSVVRKTLWPTKFVYLSSP